jgi:hypothetical protein
MKLQLLMVFLLSLSFSVNADVLQTVEGTYKGQTKKKGKDCFLKASFDSTSWFKLEPYRSDKERRKLEKKSISFSAHKSVMAEYFEKDYRVYLSSIASDSSAMFNWFISREAKDHHLKIDINNDSIPTSYEFSSERSRKKVIFECLNLKKL